MCLEEPNMFRESTKKITEKKVRNTRKDYLNLKNVPGYDLVTWHVIRKLAENGIVMITQL